MPTTPDKSPASHRMRLLERRLAPTTPLTPLTPHTPPSNPSDDDPPPNINLNMNRPLSTAPPASAPPPPATQQQNPVPVPNPDKPESVQSFASDDSTPKPLPAVAAPSPPGMSRRGGGPRRRGGGSGGGGSGGNGSSKKNNTSRYTPPTKRRLGRVDEFFKPLSATNNNNNNSNKGTASPSGAGSGGSGGATTSATTTPHTKKRPISPSNNNNNNSATTPGGVHASTTPITPASGLGLSMKTPSPRHPSSGGFDTPESTTGDSYRHLRAMIDRLKKEREAARETVEELRAENEDLQAQVDLELPQLRQSLAEREDDLRRLGDDLKEMRGRNEQLRDALRDAAVQGEKWRRQSKEHVTNADCERLGRIVAARGGVKNPFGEAWQDGREWKQVADDLSAVRSELDALERKAARRRKRRRVGNNNNKNGGGEGDVIEKEFGGAGNRSNDNSMSIGDENMDSNIDASGALSNFDASRDGAVQGLRLRTRVGLSDERDRSVNLETCEEDLDDEDDDLNDDVAGGGVGETTTVAGVLDSTNTNITTLGAGSGTTGGGGLSMRGLGKIGLKRQAASGVEIDELLHVRVHALRERERKLDARLVRLRSERDLLVREVRRQGDERGSQFGDCPTLNGRYVLLDLLGRGGFSEVFRAVDLDSGSIVACKIHQLASNWAEEKKRNFIKHAMREYHIHKELRHARVVRMLDIFEIDDNSFGTVLQYCDGCDLDAYLRERKTLNEREARAIIGQVFSGLFYLAQPERRIIHYDLKPANILLCKGKVMITDFGLSKVMGDGETTRDGMELTSQGAGTMWYLPPECFEPASEARINAKVDVWSAGVILFQMLYGRKPFGHDQSQERVFRDKTVQKEELVFPDDVEDDGDKAGSGSGTAAGKEDNMNKNGAGGEGGRVRVSDTAKDLIRKCLTRRAASRPDVRQVLAHPFLRATPKTSPAGSA